MMGTKASVGRWISMVLGVVLAVFFYAYGFQVTKVDLEETRSEHRREQLVRILRALARPEILEFEREEFIVDAPIWVGCPAGEVPEPDESGPYMVIDPPCAGPKEEVTVEGFNFEPNTRGPINFIPPSGVKLQRGTIETDAEGHFLITIELPNRKPLKEAQHISVITRRNVGSPKLTRSAKDTWDKIVETVFMALMATTFGTILAVPISFFAARNLMREVKTPIISASLSLIAWPVGIWLGMQLAKLASEFSQMFAGSMVENLGALAVGALVVWGGARWVLPEGEVEVEQLSRRALRLVMVLVIAAVGVLSLYLLSHLAFSVGDALAARLGPLDFLGIFVQDIGDIFGLASNLIVALAGGGVLGNLANRLGYRMVESLPRATSRMLSYPLAAVALGLMFALIGAGIGWLYQIADPLKTLWAPAGVGALLGLLLTLRVARSGDLSVGMAIYYVSRTVLNTLRSIEPLIMVIVFAVWVGIGPFAGVLALTLHTIAALAKLYSEQVESILPGPLEAVKAAGATRLQMIVYAVIPQIVPPYIAFTMYRWDINVRMSTIIGFAGGGGIGFLLQQNINLLNYRAASVQMFAIAIVVATMDYISSKLRERVV